MANPLSNYLKQVKRDNGDLFAEIYVMDNKGLNVGQSDVTPDYWQGDEGKWRKTRVTVTIVDPATNRVIGAVTIGVNVDELG